MWQTPLSIVSARNSTPCGLELGASGFDVLDVEGDRVAAGLEVAADRGGVHHLQGEAAGLVLAGGDFLVVLGLLEAQDLAVELLRGGVVLDEDGDEVDAGDGGRSAHARLLGRGQAPRQMYTALLCLASSSGCSSTASVSCPKSSTHSRPARASAASTSASGKWRWRCSCRRGPAAPSSGSTSKLASAIDPGSVSAEARALPDQPPAVALDHRFFGEEGAVGAERVDVEHQQPVGAEVAPHPASAPAPARRRRAGS